MKIEQLQLFIKIVEEGSMNEAARQMYLARSSVSSSIKKLESELNGQIFERNSKGVCLTPFGADAYRQARDICDKIDFLQRESCQRASGNLSIASMYCSLAYDAFIQLYKDHYHEDFIGNIEECDLIQAMENVHLGLAELGVVTLFSDSDVITMKKFEEMDLAFHQIMDRNLYVVVGPKNPLFNQAVEEIRLEDLKDYPYIVNYEFPSDYSWVNFLKGRKRKRAEVQVSDLGVALKLIEETDGILVETFIKAIYQSLYGARNYKFILLSDPQMTCKLGWIKKKDRPLTQIGEEFINIMTDKACLQGAEKSEHPCTKA